MIDNFSILLTHGLMLLCAWRIFNRPDLDREDGATPPRRGFKKRKRNDA
jgi:hypothetical protein